MGLKVQIDWHIIIYYCHYHITILMSLWALSVCHPLFMLQPLCEILIGPVMCGQQIFLMIGRVKSHKLSRHNFSLKFKYNIMEPSDENKKNINYWSDVFVNPSTPMSDQDRISLYNINTMTGRQAMRKRKYQLDGYLLIQYQILRTNIARIILQIVRRISNEMLGVKGLSLWVTSI